MLSEELCALPLPMDELCKPATPGALADPSPPCSQDLTLEDPLMTLESSGKPPRGPIYWYRHTYAFPPSTTNPLWGNEIHEVVS